MLTCPVCRHSLRPPSPSSSPLLLRCPHCAFLGFWDGEKQYTIPTHKEEQTLPVAEGMAVSPERAEPGEPTLSTEKELPPLPLPYKRKLFVKILTGSQRGNLIPFQQGRVVLGREGDIRIPDRRASRKHAVIEAISRENIYIRDLMSRNGTYVNGVRVQMYKLKAGDIIRLGDTDLEFLSEDEP